MDGEMHGDCALDEAVRKSVLPDTTLEGSANLLVCPNLDSANIAYNLLKSAAGNNVAIGPILLGCAAPAHILTPAATVTAHRQHDGALRGRGEPLRGPHLERRRAGLGQPAGSPPARGSPTASAASARAPSAPARAPRPGRVR